MPCAMDASCSTRSLKWVKMVRRSLAGHCGGAAGARPSTKSEAAYDTLNEAELARKPGHDDVAIISRCTTAQGNFGSNSVVSKPQISIHLTMSRSSTSILLIGPALLAFILFCWPSGIGGAFLGGNVMPPSLYTSLSPKPTYLTFLYSGRQNSVASAKPCISGSIAATVSASSEPGRTSMRMAQSFGHNAIICLRDSSGGTLHEKPSCSRCGHDWQSL